MRMPQKEKPDVEALVEKGVGDEIEQKRIELLKAIMSQQSQDPAVELARLNLLKEFFMKGESKAGEDPESKILSKALTFAMVNQALQATAPKQQGMDPAQLITLLSTFKEDNKSWEKFMQLYLQTQQQYYQQQAQLTQQLMAGLFGKQSSELEDLKQRTEQMIDQLNQRIDFLLSQGANKQPGVKEYLQEMIELRDTLKEAVDKLGVVEKAPEITDKSGKVQIGKLLDRGLRIAEKFIERMPQQRPEPKPVQMMPVQATKPVQAQPTTLETKPLERKLEQLEQRVEQMPEIEMIIPERSEAVPKVETKATTTTSETPVVEVAPSETEEPAPEVTETEETASETTPSTEEVPAETEAIKTEEETIEHESESSEARTAEGSSKQETG